MLESRAEIRDLTRIGYELSPLRRHLEPPLELERDTAHVEDPALFAVLLLMLENADLRRRAADVVDLPHWLREILPQAAASDRC